MSLIIYSKNSHKLIQNKFKKLSIQTRLSIKTILIESQKLKNHWRNKAISTIIGGLEIMKIKESA
jgi:hypothetical protein